MRHLDLYRIRARSSPLFRDVYSLHDDPARTDLARGANGWRGVPGHANRWICSRARSIPWEAIRDQIAQQPDPALLEAYEFVFDSPYVPWAPELADYARPSFAPGRPLVDAVTELSHRIHTEFRYQPQSTSIDMPLLEVLGNRRGVCQDFAHVMIGALRSLRLPARYVSGYLRSGAAYQGADASHAWVSVFLPVTGWLDFDPTNDLRPSDGHVTLGWGRDYGDVTPVKGIALGGGEQIVEVEVRVEPLDLPRFSSE